MALPLRVLAWLNFIHVAASLPTLIAHSEAGQVARSVRLTWEKPSDTLSILLVIGGEVVFKALAQLSGRPIVPVAFSFGWVTYSFNTLMSVAGDGRLMPEPDHDAKVFNVVSAASRDNRSWVLGRLVRDFERPLANNIGLRICVFRTASVRNGHIPGVPAWDWCYTSGVVTIIAQLGIAAIPCGLHGNWTILLITAAGTSLALLAGALPQWHLEKYACRHGSKKVIALTGGNGKRNVMVVVDSGGEGLDIEDLAGADSPLLRRSGQFSQNRFGHLRIDLRITQVACLILAILWIIILITVTGLDQDPWYLLAVGGLGMLQNVFAAGARRASGTSGIHLEEVESLEREKVMDTLMDAEDAYAGVGRVLLEEFFPGDMLRPEEEQWWQGRRTAYEQQRKENRPKSFVSNVSATVEDFRAEYRNTFGVKVKRRYSRPSQHGSNQLQKGPGTPSDASLFAYSGWMPD